MGKAMSITEFNEKYPDEDACWRHLYQVGYPNGFVCPKCGDTREPWNTARRTRKCKGCGAHISLLVGTVMEKTHLPLLKWFHAMRLMAEDKRGCSATKLEQELRIKYHSAWYLHKRKPLPIKTAFTGALMSSFAGFAGWQSGTRN